MFTYFAIVLSLSIAMNGSFQQTKERNIVTDIYQYNILKAGEINPTGWINKQLKRDLNDGYIGHYDDVNKTVTHDVFFNQNRISKRKFSLRKEWWSGEHEGYWKDAMVRMAFLTGDSTYINHMNSWMHELLQHTNEKGYIGIYRDCEAPGCRFNHERGNGELWATSRVLMAMLAYYEFTGDEEILNAAEKATKLVMQQYQDRNYFLHTSKGGGVSHGVGFFENLEWLYRLTGDAQYLEFAGKLYEDFNEGHIRDDDLKTELLLNESELFEKHGAHIAEGLFVPEFISAIQSGHALDSAASNLMEKLEQHLTPGGAMRCDEWIKGRKGTADEHYEYCGIAEMISPMNKMISFTGDFSLADRIEKMTFNAGQGARMPVLKAVSYLTTDNRIKINHSEIAKRESYDAAHFAAACCALNAGRLMPYYAEGMWMKGDDNKQLAALLYGPNVLETNMNGTPLKITEDTDYPFSDKIVFKIKPDQPVSFDLVLRKPFNCQDFELDSPDGAQVEELTDRIIISNQWKPGESVTVKFNFKIQQHNQPESKTVKGKGVYVQRGPLVYALPFEHKLKKVKEYYNSGFYRYKIKAKDKSNWKLKIDASAPMNFIPAKDDNLLTPWDDPAVKIESTLVDKKGNRERYLLVPMGNTIFRRVTFSKANHK